MGAVRKNSPKPVGVWLSLHQASLALKVSRLTVLMRALRGELAHGWVDKNVVIARASVEAALMAENEAEAER